MKTSRIAVLLALLLCIPAAGFSQSNGKHDVKSQRKAAHSYQKSIQKMRKKQMKEQAKQAKAFRKQHPQQH